MTPRQYEALLHHITDDVETYEKVLSAVMEATIILDYAINNLTEEEMALAYRSGGWPRMYLYAWMRKTFPRNGHV